MVGRLLQKSAQIEPGSWRGVSLAFEWVPESGMDDGLRWLGFEVRIESRRPAAPILGRVIVDDDQWPGSTATSRDTVRWRWLLLDEDIEAIDRDRPEGSSGPLVLRAVASGLADIRGEVFPVFGDGQIELALSHWDDLTRALGYEAPPSVSRAAGVAATHSTWRDAAHALEPARAALARGETYTALELCRDQLEGLAQPPYATTGWAALFSHLPEQKQAALQELLSGLGTYLNKVGHHRDRKATDEGEFQAMPVEHWEAELMVAVTQLILGYALRARAPERGRPRARRLGTATG